MKRLSHYIERFRIYFSPGIQKIYRLSRCFPAQKQVKFVILGFCFVLLSCGLSEPAQVEVAQVPDPTITQSITAMEQRLEQEYEAYFQRELADTSLDSNQMAQVLLRQIRQTGRKAAILWVMPKPDHLHLVLINPGSLPVIHQVSEADTEALYSVVRRFYLEVTNPRKLATTSYLEPAQQLYNWIIQPMKSELEASGIETILFCLGEGLRTLPLGALHDGNQFLIEQYGITRIPGFNLMNHEYTKLNDAQVLAMGASEFSNQNPLPAVPVELSTIIQEANPAGIWPGKAFLNDTFTLNNLGQQLSATDYKIIHLATHAEFKSGEPNQSYIQLWDSQLRLNQMPDMNWNNPPAELLVLSACQTAVGNADVELGFAGLALQSGVKSALASLWYVSDLGTLGLMSEFYQQLKTATTKAEALQKAQIAMIQQKVRFDEGKLITSTNRLSLPPELTDLNNLNMYHPFFWSGFNLIGSPW
ncbi:MAG: CHAT domain-containing protein [Microcoleaceae cyanobacterium]